MEGVGSLAILGCKWVLGLGKGVYLGGNKSS